MKTLSGLLFVVLLSISPAQAETSLERLIQGCSELTGIYKNQDEKRLLAAQMTSLSEALRGGYCRGVIDEYRRSEGYSDCRYVDWLQQATYIAQHVTMPTDRLRVEDLWSDPVEGDSHVSVKEALRQLFGIESYSRIPKLRNSINTLFRALKKEHILDEANVPIEFTSSESEHWYLLRKDLVAFHNAVILHGIYSEPKVVIKIFENVDERKELAGWARDILINRQSVASVGLIRHQLTQFLDQLDSQSDLHQNRLTNPFDNALPQMGFGPHGNLLKVLAAQTAVLSLGDSMMVRFLEGDLDGAAKAARDLSTTEPLLNRYKNMILSEFREAAEFDDLLDEWRK